MPNQQIHHARDTAANWVSNNPILRAGEIAIETDTDYIKVGNGTDAWTSLGYSNVPAGTVFPTSPQTGQRMFRTDDDLQFHYDGTRWVSELRTLNFQHSSLGSRTVDTLHGLQPTPYKGVYGIYMENCQFASFITATDTWTIRLQWFNTAGAYTDIVTDTASAGAVWTIDDNAINSVLTTLALGFRLYADEITSGAGYYGGATLFYRLTET